MFETAFGAAFEHLEETRPDLVHLAGFLGIAPEVGRPARPPKSKPKQQEPQAKKAKPKAAREDPVVVEAEVIDLKNEGGVWT